MSGTWSIEHSRGDAAALHGREPTALRTAWWFEVDRPTLVLGSAQASDAVNHRAAEDLGIEIVRRRSGGGAVLLVPDEFVWLDVVVPAGDPLWHDDVGGAMHWVGQMWQQVLTDAGLDAFVHEAGMVTTRWSRQVCFAGVGAGEVVAGQRKLVGVSQRRTRSWARMQSMCHLRWRPEIVAALVSPPAPRAEELAGLVAAVPLDRDALVEALTTVLFEH